MAKRGRPSKSKLRKFFAVIQDAPLEANDEITVYDSFSDAEMNATDETADQIIELQEVALYKRGGYSKVS